MTYKFKTDIEIYQAIANYLYRSTTSEVTKIVMRYFMPPSNHGCVQFDLLNIDNIIINLCYDLHSKEEVPDVRASKELEQEFREKYNLPQNDWNSLFSLIKVLQKYFLENNLTNGRDVWHGIEYTIDFTTMEMQTNFHYVDYEPLDFVMTALELGVVTQKDVFKWAKINSDRQNSEISDGKISFWQETDYFSFHYSEYDGLEILNPDNLERFIAYRTSWKRSEEEKLALAEIKQLMNGEKLDNLVNLSNHLHILEEFKIHFSHYYMCLYEPHKDGKNDDFWIEKFSDLFDKANYDDMATDSVNILQLPAEYLELPGFEKARPEVYHEYVWNYLYEAVKDKEIHTPPYRLALKKALEEIKQEILDSNSQVHQWLFDR